MDIGLLFSIICLLFWLIMVIKTFVTGWQHRRILTAIYRHNLLMIHRGRSEYMLSYDCIEKFERTLFRLWDWGYKHIVPPEVLKRIKPYIK
jgi:hypothetical protein